MAYKEFCAEIAPSVLELQDECSKLTEAEFSDYRMRVMQEIGGQELSDKFMTAVFDMIYNNVFGGVA
ncbi:MAG: hypothetical protein HFG64_07645 [Lachnospiraceae bacterium]|jgi:hypothetical protein|nr:hypothetical protein [Lachnospiraceae bacterium]